MLLDGLDEASTLARYVIEKFYQSSLLNDFPINCAGSDCSSLLEDSFTLLAIVL